MNLLQSPDFEEGDGLSYAQSEDMVRRGVFPWRINPESEAPEVFACCQEHADEALCFVQSYLRLYLCRPN